MTDQNNAPQKPQDPAGALVFQQQTANGNQGSMANHAQLMTNTGDLANTIVVRKEAEIRQNRNKVLSMRAEANQRLEGANEELRRLSNKFGTAMNAHIKRQFKQRVQALNTQNSENAIQGLLAFIGCAGENISGECSTMYGFSAPTRRFTIVIDSVLTLPRLKNTEEMDTGKTKIEELMPRQLAFTMDNMKQVMSNLPDLFFPEAVDMCKNIVRQQEHTEAIAKVIAQLGEELEQLSYQLTQIPALERVARAKITETQFDQMGMKQYIEELQTDDTSGIMDKMLGRDQGDEYDTRFKLPAAPSLPTIRLDDTPENDERDTERDTID